MKEILKKIHKILLSLSLRSPEFTVALGDEVQRLGKMIDEFPEDERLEDILAESETKFLRRKA